MDEDKPDDEKPDKEEEEEEEDDEEGSLEETLDEYGNPKVFCLCRKPG